MTMRCRPPCHKGMLVGSVDREHTFAIVRWVCPAGHSLHQHVPLAVDERPHQLEPWHPASGHVLPPAPCEMCGAPLEPGRSARYCLHCRYERDLEQTAAVRAKLRAQANGLSPRTQKSRDRLVAAMERHAWDRGRAAAELHISRKSLNDSLYRFGVKTPAIALRPPHKEVR